MKKPYASSYELQESLENRILHGLSCEWENACDILPVDSQTRRMRPPFFCLRNMTRRLGYWSSEKNEIALSRSFVLNAPWDDIREVLVHEMAHQYAEQVLEAGHEPPHGPKFQTACRLLRANPKASGRYRPLYETIRENTVNENDRILIRVKKLMSLAESDNRHEAEAAMAKAHLLIRKYNIDLLQETSRRNFISAFVGTPALRRHREEYYLANLLQTFYFIQGIWVSAYVLRKGKMGRVFEISGTVSNVKLADYVYHFVINFIDSQWRRYNGLKRLNRYRKTDFAVGIIEGFSNKLSCSRDDGGTFPAANALVSVEDPLLKQYMAHKYPYTRHFQRTGSIQDDKVLKDGYSIGEKLVVSKGITHRGNGGRRIAYDKSFES